MYEVPLFMYWYVFGRETMLANYAWYYVVAKSSLKHARKEC